MKYFVWIKGLRGPSPQFWDDEKTEGGKPVATLFKAKVPLDLSLDEAVKMYPAPVKTDD